MELHLLTNLIKKIAEYLFCLVMVKYKKVWFGKLLCFLVHYSLDNFFVSFTDGQILKWNIGTQFFISNEAGLGLMAEFSSAGPTSDFYFKPDLVAPGANINSTYLNNSYMKMSGTSMASPMIAGCAALIKQAKPTLSPQEIKYLMMNTADILYNPASNLPYSPTLQGAGRVNIFNAVNSTGLIYPAALILEMEK